MDKLAGFTKIQSKHQNFRHTLFTKKLAVWILHFLAECDTIDFRQQTLDFRWLGVGSGEGGAEEVINTAVGVDALIDPLQDIHKFWFRADEGIRPTDY